MKATELRIGNWVYAINRRGGIHIPENAPLKALQIGVFNSEVLPIDTSPASVTEWIVVSNTDISPIPLTEQILVEFGFKTNWNDGGKQVLRTEYRTKGLTLYFHTRGKDKKTACMWHDVGFDTDLRVAYVHQLQNLYFALTGTELTRTEQGKG